MRISRWYGLLATMALAALVALPAVASAAGPLLTNEYGQSFLGSGANTADPDDGCIACHGSSFDQTSHGQFVKVTTATIEPSADSGMYEGLPLGGEIDPADVFTTGAGTGLREYLVFGESDLGPFGVAVLEWDPSAPSLWEIDGATTELEFEDYACNQCHMLGATKVGVTPPGLNGVAGTRNAWATVAGEDPESIATWIPGASIQCERCHGTGLAAAADAGAHWGTGVKVVGYNVGSTTAKVSSGNILKSEVCGQCHGSFKSGGNIAGYTPDRNINDFMTNQYTLSDVPTSFSATAKFFPNGENKGLKHVYYTEWALSGHSVRGAFTATSTGEVTPYQASGASHYNAAGSSRVLCNRCHTGEGYLKRKGADIMSGWTEGTDAAGKIGQECAACHISHGDVGATGTTANGEAVGMGVRPAEQANGQYSTLGLSVDNKSICEDCHNWQREITNAGALPTLSSASVNASTGVLTVGKYASHPQREVYHGRAMVEVDQASDFMPGAKCEQCHMPATKSDFPDKTGIERYSDRSWKRYSHRMFIMRPGDAKAWGLAPWGDSCSPCHTGETQDQLEANLVTWQDDAAVLAADANAAIKAAVLRSGTATNTALPEANLIMRAATNVSNFTNDGSAGAHNPPYIQAALAKSIELAKSAGGSITMVAPAKVDSNALFGIQGEVENGDDTDAAGVTVKLFKGDSLVGTAVTDDEGNYGFSYAQTAGSTYTVKWERSSASVSDLTASATVAMNVEPVATDLELTIVKNNIKRGVHFRVSGSLDPEIAGASIVMQAKAPGATSYKTLARSPITADADGDFTFVTEAHYVGTYTYRAKFLGDATHLGSSATAKIRIVR